MKHVVKAAKNHIAKLRGSGRVALSVALVALVAACGGSNKYTDANLLNACPALPAPASSAGSLASVVDGLVAQEMSAQGLPGLSVAIAKNGHVLYAQGYGYADLPSCTPAQASTVYQIGSITKQFTAAAVLQLEAAGKINLDNSVVSYLPAYAFDPRITVRMLLNQTAGLDDYLNDPAHFPPPSNWQAGVPEPTVLSAIATAALTFTPGSAYAYSNSNYYVLGAIVEVVSGSSYANYMSTQVFASAGLTNTSYVKPAQAASAYTYAPSSVLSAGTVPDPSIFFAAGELWSNVTDLAQWDAALLNGKVIAAPQLTEMLTPPAGVTVNGQPGVPTPYAMGWLLTSDGTRTVAWHNGETLAYTGFNTVYLDNGFSISILTNLNITQENPVLAPLATALAQKICGSAATASAC